MDSFDAPSGIPEIPVAPQEDGEIEPVADNGTRSDRSWVLLHAALRPEKHTDSQLEKHYPRMTAAVQPWSSANASLGRPTRSERRAGRDTGSRGWTVLAARIRRGRDTRYKTCWSEIIGKSLDDR